MSSPVPDPPEWDPGEQIPAGVVVPGVADGELVSSCCGADLNVTGVERNLMRWRPVRLSEQGVLVVSRDDAKHLECFDDQDIEVWCGTCQQVLTVKVDFDDS